MTTNQPVALNVAIAGLVSSAVTLAAIFWPDRLDAPTQGAIVALANSAIVVVTIILTQRQTTPVANPTLPANTEVKVQGTEDTVVVQPTPPGPTGIEGGAAEDGGVG
jgi:hypothetical protein